MALRRVDDEELEPLARIDPVIKHGDQIAPGALGDAVIGRQLNQAPAGDGRVDQQGARVGSETAGGLDRVVDLSLLKPPGPPAEPETESRI